MFSQKSKFNNRSLRVAAAVALVALVAGIYFAFKPFPAGPGLGVAANVSAGAAFESGAPQHYSGKGISSSMKAVAPAGFAFESGAPLHYSNKVIAPYAPSVPSSSIPQHYIDAGYALKQTP